MSNFPHQASLRLNDEVIDKSSVGSQISSTNDLLIRDVLHFLEDWFDNEDHIHQQTSGSTGTPKTISIPKAMMLNSAAMTNRFFGLGPGKTALLCLSPRYIAGKMMIVRAMLGGLKLLTTNVSANPLETLTETVDFAAMVPLQVAEILNREAEKLNLIKTLIIGGSLLDQNTEEKLQAFETSFWHTYGMTETVSHIALRKINGSDKSQWFGPLDGISLGTDNRNCLVIDAPMLHTQTIVTNDLVQFAEDGRFRILGRTDDVVISAGHKIHPALVEERLASLIPHAFVVSSKHHPSAGEVPILVIRHEYQVQELYRLWQQMEGLLLQHEMPARIEFVGQIPLLPSGKIDRKAVKKDFANTL
jgi:o-succinylbenzoate---CoA ligase